MGIPIAPPAARHATCGSPGQGRPAQIRMRRTAVVATTITDTVVKESTVAAAILPGDLEGAAGLTAEGGEVRFAAVKTGG